MKGYFRLLVVMLAAVITPAAVGHQAPTHAREPVSPDEDEIAAHVVGTLPVIRMDFKKFPDLQFVGMFPVEVLVDVQGNVTSTKLEDEDDTEPKDLKKSEREMAKALRAEATDRGMQLHFRPFEDQGHPTPAQFEIYLPVRDLVEHSPKHVPFPHVHNWNSVKIVLSRTGCFGSCPSYRVEVHGDGTVLYDGNAFVAITGPHHDSVSSYVVSELVEAFRAADFFSLKGTYAWGATDLPMYKTSISIDGRTKEVVDYAGEVVGMPESVSKLEETIDHLSGVERWTKGNGETVPSLTHERFDFTSPKAGQMLANAALMGNPDVVRELIAAGVMVSNQPVQARFGERLTALESAAKRGDVEMLRALLGADIKDPAAKTQALKQAAFAGKLDAMRLLIDSGADPNLADDKGNTPLILNSRDLEIAQILIGHGANVNARTDDGVTPLHNAETVELTRFLLEHGADPFAKTKDGKTALDLAKQQNHTEQAALLEAAMAGKKQ